MNDLLPCPFCSLKLEWFGNDLNRGGLYKHPLNDGCCLQGLIFDRKRWSVRSQLAEAQAKLARVIETGKDLYAFMHEAFPDDPRVKSWLKAIAE